MSKHNSKIAICIYGFLRSYPFTVHTFIDNLAKVYNADIFIYTPNTSYAKTDQDVHHTKDDVNHIDPHQMKKTFKSQLKSIVTWNYNPDIFKELIKKDKLPEQNIFEQYTWRTYSMFYHIKRVLENMCNYENKMGFKYDNVILTRLDLFYYTKVDLSTLQPNIVYYPIGEGLDQYDKRRYGAAPVFGFNKELNDQFLVGSRKHIITLIHLFDDVKKYVLKDNIEMNNETLIGYHFIQHNIDFKPFDMMFYKLYR